ncbi:MAG: sigma-70 family RNA polymerase sigma factor [Acidobacteriota bacterium]
MSADDITQLLQEWCNGNEAAQDKLMLLVTDKLRQLANYYMQRERPDHTLQPTALINEAYLRLVDIKDKNWQNRAHFFGIAARLMRQILVDHARNRNAAKRVGNRDKVSLTLAENVVLELDKDLIALDDALTSFAQINPLASSIVELRFFGELTIEETAAVLKVSNDVVKNQWKAARAWLFRELSNKNMPLH